MYSSLQEQASNASNLVPLPDTNGNMDASELLKEKVCLSLVFDPVILTLHTKKLLIKKNEMFLVRTSLI